MLGDNIESVGWPACGEIDIMENVGSEPNKVHGSLHGPGYSGATPLTAIYTRALRSPTSSTFSPSNGNHNNPFLCGWQPVLDRDPANLPTGRRWYLTTLLILLNVAVGGNFPGNPDASSMYPQTMSVDYVRVYARK